MSTRDIPDNSTREAPAATEQPGLFVGMEERGNRNMRTNKRIEMVINKNRIRMYMPVQNHSIGMVEIGTLPLAGTRAQSLDRPEKSAEGFLETGRDV